MAEYKDSYDLSALGQSLQECLNTDSFFNLVSSVVSTIENEIANQNTTIINLTNTEASHYQYLLDLINNIDTSSNVDYNTIINNLLSNPVFISMIQNVHVNVNGHTITIQQFVDALSHYPRIGSVVINWAASGCSITNVTVNLTNGNVALFIPTVTDVDTDGDEVTDTRRIAFDCADFGGIPAAFNVDLGIYRRSLTVLGEAKSFTSYRLKGWQQPVFDIAPFMYAEAAI
jgi:hypothetical protein